MLVFTGVVSMHIDSLTHLQQCTNLFLEVVMNHKNAKQIKQNLIPFLRQFDCQLNTQHLGLQNTLMPNNHNQHT